jgi:hypothetical protein
MTVASDILGQILAQIERILNAKIASIAKTLDHVPFKIILLW